MQLSRPARSPEGLLRSNDAPGDHKDREWRRMSAHFESAISRLRPTSERRARTTAVAAQAAAQNGTSGSGASTFDVPQMWASSPSSGSSADGNALEARHAP